MSTTTTAISWADRSWNPVRGCSRVSAGCEHCYAETIAARFSGPGQPYDGLARRVNGHPQWTGEIQVVHRERLAPLRWKRPARIFVNSMSDLFHPEVPYWWLDDLFDTMRKADWHTFQILTKRPERMREYLTDAPSRHREPAPNIWLGVSAEDQATADARVPVLLDTPAALRFVSAEPLLGPLDLHHYFACCPSCGQPTADARAAGYGEGCAWCETAGIAPGIDWLIVGGESGPGARPMHPAWPLALWRQCVAAGVPFHFKQWGAWRPALVGDFPERQRDYRTIRDQPGGHSIDLVRSERQHTAPLLFERGRYLDATGPVQQFPATRKGTSA